MTTYYLIFRKNALRLIPILAEHEEIFVQANAHRILASGETILEALRKFDALPLVFCDGLVPSLFLSFRNLFSLIDLRLTSMIFTNGHYY
jgi:hypothetical protein